ncbi:MAG: DUF883 family protein [Alphaproteobacteria bacterium]|nr:DUF883 family protein [Alphaproteobacteria bacterium]
MAGPTGKASDGDASYDDLKKDFESLKDDVRKLTETLAGLAESESASVRNRARAAARQARAEADRLKDAAGEEFDEAVTRARSTIAEKPLVSLAAALGAGLIIGLLLRRS